MEGTKQIYNQINQTIEREYQSIKNPGLLYGKMGLAIYFYTIPLSHKNEEHENLADSLIDDIYQSVPQIHSLSFEHGLTALR